MASDFEIQILSDDDHEDLTAEILYRGEFCVLLSQEKGFDKLEIEIHPRSNHEHWTFPWEEFYRAVKDAADDLWELRRSPEP